MALCNTHRAIMQATANIAINTAYIIFMVGVVTLANADNTTEPVAPSDSASTSEFSRSSPKLIVENSGANNKPILSAHRDTHYEKNSIYIKTHEGLSLWKIANHISTAKNIDVNQVMLILLNENPNSFDEYNINSLKARTLLAFPNQPQLILSDDEAAEEIQRQHVQWKNNNSVTQQSNELTDEASVGANENEQDNLDYLSNKDDQEQIVHELQLQSPADKGARSHQTQAAPVSGWENLPEASNASIGEQIIGKHKEINQLDDAVSENQQVSVVPEHEAIELSWDLAMLTALSDRLRSELSSVSVQQLLLNSVDNFKAYYYRTTPYHKQWLIGFFVMLGVILLGLIIGRNQRCNQRRNQFRHQFVDQAQGPLVSRQAGCELDNLPTITWTDRDVVLAKITRQAVVDDFETDITANVADSYSVVTHSARFNSQQNLSTTRTGVSARDFIMAQIAMRRRHVVKEETHVSQTKPLSFEKIIEKAKILMAYGLYAQAISVLQSAVENHPEDIAVKCLLVEAYFYNRQTQDFLLLAEELQACLQAHSLEWKQLQGYAYRLVPEHSGFEFDTSIIQSEVEKQVSIVEAQKPDACHDGNDSLMDTDDTIENDADNEFEQDDDFALEDCATQLDLAKAYIAMGNTEQAQQMLNAVINRGDVSQRQQAYQLLLQLANS